MLKKLLALLLFMPNPSLAATQLYPQNNIFIIAGCTVGTSSGQCLAAGLVTNHVQIQNNSASATIACTGLGNAAVLNANNSITLTAGQSALWGPTTAGVPNGTLNCIASASSSSLYIEYN